MGKLFSMKYLSDYEKDIKYKDFRKIYLKVIDRKIRFKHKMMMYLAPFIIFSLLSIFYKFLFALTCFVWFIIWMGIVVLCFIFANLFTTTVLFRGNMDKIRNEFLAVDGEVKLTLYEDEIEILTKHGDKFTFQYTRTWETKNVIFLEMNHVIPKERIDPCDLSIFREIIIERSEYYLF